MSSTSRGVDRRVQRATLRKLEMIHAAKDVEISGSLRATGWSGSSAIVVVSTASG